MLSFVGQEENTDSTWNGIMLRIETTKKQEHKAYHKSAP